jgi:ABC-2 type transport system permease protein
MNPTRFRRFRAVAFAVTWRAIHNYLTNPAFLIPSLIFPLFFFAAFAGGLSTLIDLPNFDFPTGYTAFQFVFVLLQAVAFGGVFTGVALAMDFESGFARRLMLAAPNRGGILVGYVIFAIVRGLIPSTLLVAVALPAGMQIGGDGVDLLGLFGLALIVNITTSLWGMGLAMRIRSIEAGPLMQTSVFVVLLLAPVYVPLRLLSGWLHGIASINPTTALLEAGRGFISGDTTLVARAFAVAIGLMVLFLLWAHRGLRRAEAAR